MPLGGQCASVFRQDRRRPARSPPTRCPVAPDSSAAAVSQSGPARVVIVLLGAAAAIAVLAICGGVGYIVSVAGSAPDIAELKPVDQGATSVVYAADGKTRLGFIQGDTLRTPVAAVGDAAVGARRDGRDRGPALLQAQRRRLRGHRPRGGQERSSGETVQGGSTLTMQLVRNLYSGNRARNGIAGYKRKIREAKLAEELEDRHPGTPRQALDPHAVPQQRPVRDGRRADGRRRPGRLARLLRQAREPADARGGRAARRPPAGAVGVQPVPRPAAAPQAPQRGAATRWPLGVHHRRRRRPTRARAPLGVKRTAYYAKRRESYFFDYVSSELIEKYGVDARAPGRAQGLHDDRPEAAAGRAPRDRRPPAEPRRPLVGAREHRPEDRVHPGDGLLGRLRGVEVQPRRPGPPPAGLDVQDHGADDRAAPAASTRKTTYDSKPLNFTDPVYGKIEVNTDDHRYGGSTPIFQALVRSDNTVFQQLDLDLGPDQVRQTAYDMGITSKLDGYPAEGLGGLRIGVSPLEMARAYATIANGGWRVQPRRDHEGRLPRRRARTPRSAARGA